MLFHLLQVSCDTSLWAAIGGQDVDRLPSASTCYNTLKVEFQLSVVLLSLLSTCEDSCTFLFNLSLWMASASDL